MFKRNGVSLVENEEKYHSKHYPFSSLQDPSTKHTDIQRKGPVGGGTHSLEWSAGWPTAAGIIGRQVGGRPAIYNQGGGRGEVGELGGRRGSFNAKSKQPNTSKGRER